jgi:hypothetical protein
MIILLHHEYRLLNAISTNQIDIFYNYINYANLMSPVH